MHISDWSSDVCSSDLLRRAEDMARGHERHLDLAQGQRLAISHRHARLRAIARLHDRQRLGGRPHGNMHATRMIEIGRESCRESVCQDVSISVVAVPLKKNNKHIYELSNLSKQQ